MNLDKKQMIAIYIEYMNYKYIENEKYSKLIQLCIDSDNTPYSIHFCAYNINTQLYIEGNKTQQNDIIEDDYLDTYEIYNDVYPFLQFIVEKKPNSLGSNEYSLPTFEYTCPNIESISSIKSSHMFSEDDEREPLQIHFENECFEKLFNMFTDISEIHTKNISISEFYKGFIKNEENQIHVLFDMSKLIDKLKPEYTLAIIDELVFKQKIYDTPVCKNIIRFFKKNNELRYIQTIDGYDYPFPFQLYMYKIENNSKYYISKDSNELYVPSEHSVLGSAYYFFNNLENIDMNNCKRFCCFIVKCVYDIHLKDDQIYYNGELIDEDRTAFNDIILGSSSIYFHENNRQHWGIKNNLHFTEF